MFVIFPKGPVTLFEWVGGGWWVGGIFLRQVKNERLSGWDVHLKITLDGIRSRNPRNMLNKMCKFPPTQKKKIVKVSKICDFI